MIEGLINRQVSSVLIDPYANAFYRNEYEGEQSWSSDITYKLGFLNTKVKAMNSLIHERKYELDSLCALLRLSSGYFEKSFGDLTPFNEKWIKSIELILETIREELLKQRMFKNIHFQEILLICMRHYIMVDNVLQIKDVDYQNHILDLLMILVNFHI